MEAKGGAGILAEIFALRALQVGIKNKTRGVGVFQQDHPHRGPATRIGGGERHRGGIGRFPSLGGGKPLVEKIDRIVGGHDAMFAHGGTRRSAAVAQINARIETAARIRFAFDRAELWLGAHVTLC